MKKEAIFLRKYVCLLIFILFGNTTLAVAKDPSQADIYQQRMNLYRQVEAMTFVPWYYLAAIDQYERNIRLVRSDLPKPEGLTGIYFSPEQWSGFLNKNKDDHHPFFISLFNGIGRDGNSDGKAKRTDDLDILYTFAHYLLHYGIDEEHIRIALWDYYQKDKTVGIILNIAKLYRHFGTLDLGKKAFPLPVNHHYSYKSTWGVARGWGGRRIHEGTDIFANYGVPVQSTAYGVIEMKGWNKYGGWRIGIRDVHNTYHYFAHLNGFAKDLQIGQIVEPGTVLGYVGSTGYGPKGTSGKFPPHLHFGMYKYNGRTEWSFDPYPHLRIAERNNRSSK